MAIDAPAGQRRRRPWLRLAVLVIALAAATAILLAPYQSMAPRRLDLGTPDATSALSGFSFPEAWAGGQTFRWSGADGLMRFSGVANRPLRLRLSLQALRPDGEATVTITANGQTVTSFPAAAAFSEHSIDLSRAVVGFSGELVAGVHSTPFSAAPDTRLLGAGVAWAELAPAGGIAVPPQAALAGIILPVLLAIGGLFWLSARKRWSPAAPVALGIGMAALIAMWLNRTESAGGWWGWALAATVWAPAVAIVWGPPAARRMAAWLRAEREAHPTGFWLVVMAVLFLLVYLPLARTEGYWGDIEIYMAWTHQITHNGIHTAYTPDFVVPPNTTPGLLYPFRLIGEVFRSVWSPDFPPPWIDRTDQPWLRYMLRLPALLCTVLIAAIAFVLTRRRWGDRMALIVAAAYLFNPAVIFEAAYYGQTGAVHGVLMLIAVVALAEGYPAWGWAALVAGMLTKPQADLFLPLLVLLTWRRYGGRALLRSALAGVAAALLILSPFILHGTLGEMWAHVSHPADYHPILSAAAHNVWWLASLGNGQMSDLTAPVLFGNFQPLLSLRNLGLALVGLAYLLVLIRVWRDTSAEGLYQSAAYLFAAFFMLATQIHENHLIPMFSLLLLACPGNRRLWAIYWLFAISATLNMSLHYPDFLRVLVPQNPNVWGGPEMAAPRWLSALLQVSIFVYWTYYFVRATFAGFRRVTANADPMQSAMQA